MADDPPMTNIPVSLLKDPPAVDRELWPLSACCNARLLVTGHTTHYYICTLCQLPADPRRPAKENLVE